MPAPSSAGAPVRLIWGDDDFAVQRRARQVFDGWLALNPGADAETIHGGAANVGEALKAMAQLREALQTLPFFGGTKSVWLKDFNFAGEDRVSEAATVVEALSDLGRDLTAFRWEDVRLLMSAGKLDRRRSFFKAIDKLAEALVAEIEHFPGISAEDRDWRDKAETLAATELRNQGKRPVGEALMRLVDQVGPHARQLISEVQKLTSYVGDREEVGIADVDAVVTHGRHARAFALGDAVGDRHLGRALRCLGDELWALRSDPKKSEIGLLYGLISKVRALLLARELLEEGLVVTTTEYRNFAGQLKRLPPDRFAADKRFNPMEINAYVMFRAAQQARNFSRAELVSAMEELLHCNQRLVGSGLDGGLVLELAVTRIIGAGPRPRAGAARLDDRGSRA